MLLKHIHSDAPPDKDRVNTPKGTERDMLKDDIVPIGAPAT